MNPLSKLKSPGNTVVYPHPSAVDEQRRRFRQPDPSSDREAPRSVSVMKVFHIVGCKKHGKTTLVVELIRELTRRGLRVGSLKHCGHDHELDTPGTDSFRHREAGALSSAIVTPSLVALFETRTSDDDPYARLRSSFDHLVIVLIEGGLGYPGPKLEVWRETMGTRPLALTNGGIVGIVTDDQVDVELPVWRRADIEAIAEQVLLLAEDI